MSLKRTYSSMWVYSIRLDVLDLKTTDSPDEACWYEVLYGFSWDFVQLHIPLLIWHIQHMELHKLNTWNTLKESNRNRHHEENTINCSNSVNTTIFLFSSANMLSYPAARWSPVFRMSHRLTGQLHLLAQFGTRAREMFSLSPGLLSHNLVKSNAVGRPLEFPLWECQQRLLWCWWWQMR